MGAVATVLESLYQYYIIIVLTVRSFRRDQRRLSPSSPLGRDQT
jgi:hypothetical protein